MGGKRKEKRKRKKEKEKERKGKRKEKEGEKVTQIPDSVSKTQERRNLVCEQHERLLDDNFFMYFLNLVQIPDFLRYAPRLLPSQRE